MSKMQCFLILIVLVLFQVSVDAQSVDVSKMGPPIKLKPYKNTNAVVYDMDSIKFYFKRSIVIKYLKKTLKESSDSSESIVLNVLEHTPQKQIVIKKSPLIYDSKTDRVDITIMQNNYLVAIDEELRYLLITGKASVYDNHTMRFLKEVYFDDDLGERFGATIDDIRIYYPNGQLLYSKRLYNHIIKDELKM